MFYLGPRGSGPRSFFLDADLSVTRQAQSWLKHAGRKWRGATNEIDRTALSINITGTPKVRLVGLMLLPSVYLTSLTLVDGKDEFADQSFACADC